MRDAVPPSLKRFIWDIQSMVELAESEREILVIGRDLMARLVAKDDWLPAMFATPNPGGVQQFQLYCDGMGRFSVASTILWDGMALPICQEPVWEIMGLLRGAMTRQRFGISEDGRARAKGAFGLLEPGAVDTFSPKSGDALQLTNAFGDRVSISIHVYGGEIGSLARRTLAWDGRVSEQVSGYANTEDGPAYDIWSIQTEIRD